MKRIYVEQYHPTIGFSQMPRWSFGNSADFLAFLAVYMFQGGVDSWLYLNKNYEG